MYKSPFTILLEKEKRKKKNTIFLTLNKRKLTLANNEFSSSFNTTLSLTIFTLTHVDLGRNPTWPSHEELGSLREWQPSSCARVWNRVDSAKQGQPSL